MSRLLNRFQIAEELPNIITQANDYLILISPYFKLNSLLLQALNTHILRKDLQLCVVYGKNEEDKRRSLCDDDLRYFKSFQNVEVRYHKRLHAKIYLNEEKCLITSMNLHDYSLNENIEVGVLTSSKKWLDSLDKEAFNFAWYIVEKSTLEFKKETKTRKSFFGLFKSEGEPEILIEKSRTGFCIRTGVSIPHNLRHPYCTAAYNSWNVYGNYHYKEKHCHTCGAAFQTSMAKPECLTCYSKGD